MPPVTPPPALRQLATMSGQANQVAALTGQLAAYGEDSGWIEPALENGWKSFGYEPPAYRRIGNLVRLRGVFSHSGASKSTAFTLPAGFRPVLSALFPSANYPGGSEPGSIQVTGAGAVEPIYAGTPEQISIDGVAFTTD